MGAVKYWIWLNSLGKVPGILAHTLLREFGSPEAVYAAQEEAYARIPYLTEPIRGSLRNKSLQKAEQIVETCEKGNIQILTISYAAYPER